MKTLFTLIAIVLSSSIVFSQLEGVVLEQYTVDYNIDNLPNEYSFLADMTTYRLYAELSSPNYQLLTMGSLGGEEGCSPLSFTSASGFFNSSFGSTLGSNINPAFILFFPELAFDSWLTIGMENSGPEGDVQSIGAPLSNSFGSAVLGSDMHATDGNVFTLPDNLNAFPVGPDNRVLLGQFIVQGCMSFAINLGIRETDSGDMYYYVHDSDCSDDYWFMSDDFTIIDGSDLGLAQSMEADFLCEDPNACNFNELGCACVYVTCTGCYDPEACNYNPTGYDSVLFCDYNSCAGCTDETACNFDPEATISQPSSCSYQGCYTCDDPEACNFNPEPNDIEYCCYDCGCDFSFAANYVSNPICQINPCSYNTNGIVFHDLNNDGVKQEDEPGIPNVSLTFGDITVITNLEGVYSLESSSGPVPDFDIPEPYQYITAFPPSGGGLSSHVNQKIGLAIELTEYHLFASVNTFNLTTFSGLGGVMICDQYNGYGLSLTNVGPEPIMGQVQVTMSDLIVDIDATSTIDSIVGNVAYISMGVIESFETATIEVGLLAPDYESMWAIITTTFEFVGYHEDLLIEGPTINRLALLVCAYDPNDKQVLPIGYEEPHFIEPETTLEYTIRFQNTGNFYAFNVEVVDTLSQHLDLSSLEIVEATHSMQTIIDHNSREIRFLFEDIMLPDSTCCGDESIGSFIFRVKLNDDLPGGTLIENTAHIFFDQNPAIVTNTTWNTVFTCSPEDATFSYPEGVICTNAQFEVSNNSQWFNTKNWYIDGVPMGFGPEVSLLFEEPGEYEITLEVENPICSATHTEVINVEPTPIADFTHDGNLLTASDGFTHQWMLDGELILGATSQSFEITESGDYQVVVTDDTGCWALSQAQTVLYSSIVNMNNLNPRAFPIPVNSGSYLTLAGVNAEKLVEIRLVDSSGRVVWSGSNTTQVPTYGLSAGWYVLQGLHDQTHFNLKIQVTR